MNYVFRLWNMEIKICQRIQTHSSNISICTEVKWSSEEVRLGNLCFMSWGINKTSILNLDEWMAKRVKKNACEMFVFPFLPRHVQWRLSREFGNDKFSATIQLLSRSGDQRQAIFGKLHYNSTHSLYKRSDHRRWGKVFNGVANAPHGSESYGNCWDRTESIPPIK